MAEETTPPSGSDFAAHVRKLMAEDAPAPNPQGAPAAPAPEQKPDAAPKPESKSVIPDLELPKQEAKKPDAKPADDDTPPEVKTEEAKKGWKTWKAQHEAVLKERDELKAKFAETETTLKGQLDAINRELAEARKRVVDPKEIEALKGERDELRHKIKLKAVEEDPSWQQEISKPIEDALSKARINAPKEIRGTLEKLMQLAPSEERQDAIDKLLEEHGVSEYKRGVIGAAQATLDNVLAKKSALLSDQKRLVEQYEQFQKQSAEQKLASQRQQLEEAADAVLRVAADPEKGLGVFKPATDTPEARQAANDAVNTARHWATADLDPRSRANLAAWAVHGQHATKLLAAAEQELTKLRSQVEKLTAATPSGGASNPAPKVDEPAGFVDAVKRLMGT